MVQNVNQKSHYLKKTLNPKSYNIKWNDITGKEIGFISDQSPGPEHPNDFFYSCINLYNLQLIGNFAQMKLWTDGQIDDNWVRVIRKSQKSKPHKSVWDFKCWREYGTEQGFESFYYVCLPEIIKQCLTVFCDNSQLSLITVSVNIVIMFYETCHNKETSAASTR